MSGSRMSKRSRREESNWYGNKGTMKSETIDFRF